MYMSWAFSSSLQKILNNWYWNLLRTLDKQGYSHRFEISYAIPSWKMEAWWIWACLRRTHCQLRIDIEVLLLEYILNKLKFTDKRKPDLRWAFALSWSVCWFKNCCPICKPISPSCWFGMKFLNIYHSHVSFKRINIGFGACP